MLYPRAMEPLAAREFSLGRLKRLDFTRDGPYQALFSVSRRIAPIFGGRHQNRPQRHPVDLKSTADESSTQNVHE